MVMKVAMLAVAAAAAVHHVAATCDTHTDCVMCQADTGCSWCAAAYEVAGVPGSPMPMGVCVDDAAACTATTVIGSLLGLYSPTGDDVTWAPQVLPSGACPSVVYTTMPAVTSCAACAATTVFYDQLYWCDGTLSLDGTEPSSGGVCTSATCSRSLSAPTGTTMERTVDACVATCQAITNCRNCIAEPDCSWCQVQVSRDGAAAEPLSDVGLCQVSGVDCEQLPFKGYRDAFDYSDGSNTSAVSIKEVTTSIGNTCTTTDAEYAKYDDCNSCDSASETGKRFMWCRVSFWYGAESGDADNTGRFCHTDCPAFGDEFDSNPAVWGTFEACGAFTAKSASLGAAAVVVAAAFFAAA